MLTDPARLFRIKGRIDGEPPELRLDVRQQKRKPALEAAAILYGLEDNTWPGFYRLPCRLDLHSNTIENDQRPVKLTQRNSPFRRLRGSHRHPDPGQHPDHKMAPKRRRS